MTTTAATGIGVVAGNTDPAWGRTARAWGGSTPGHRADPWIEPAIKQGQHGRRRPGLAEDSSTQAALSGRDEEMADGHTSGPDPGFLRGGTP